MVSVLVIILLSHSRGACWVPIE